MKKNLICKLMSSALTIGTLISVAGGAVNAYAAENAQKNKWVMSNGFWTYYDENGNLAKDTTLTIKGKEYKFDSNGAWIPNEEVKKVIDEQEAYDAKYPETNECSEDYKKRDDRWCNKDGNWYFNWDGTYKDENRDQDEWDFINGYWYHFDKDGKMEKNVTIKDEKGNDCILNSDGVLTNRTEPEFTTYSWQTIDGKTYYMNEQGNKKTGWIMTKDLKWYYLDENGVKQVNTTIIDNGKNYVLGADGAWIK